MTASATNPVVRTSSGGPSLNQSMAFQDTDVSASVTTHLHLALVFSTVLVCSRAFSYWFLSFCIGLSIVSNCLTSCVKFCFLNSAPSGMKHISARRGSFLTPYYRTNRADRTTVFYLRYCFFFWRDFYSLS